MGLLNGGGKMNEFWKKFAGWIGVAVLTVGGFIAYLFTSRKNSTDNRRIQRDKQRIRDGAKRTKESHELNSVAKEHVESAGTDIDNAINSVANAQSILNRARERSEK